MQRNRPIHQAITVIGILVSSMLTGCATGPMDMVPIRIVSEPSAARFFVPRLGLEGVTPYDFTGIDPSDQIVFGKEGYKEWIGRIQDLNLIRDDTYQVDLVPLKQEK